MDIVPSIMTQQEAVTWERQVGSTANELRRLLVEGYEREAWRALGHGSWTECLRKLAERYDLSEGRLFQLHSANQNALAIGIPDELLTKVSERQLRPLSRLHSDEDKRQAWQRASETAPNGTLTAAHVEKVVNKYLVDDDGELIDVGAAIYEDQDPLLNEWLDEEYEEIAGARPDWSDDSKGEYAFEQVEKRVDTFVQSEKAKTYITLTEWEQGKRWQGSPSHGQMNTVNENIEWAAFSWNPITGCLHNCAYCYARDIANRFYAQKFQPSFIPERLSHPKNTKPIDPRWPGDIGHKNVFTCSMADLFGKWVPTEWIREVLQVIHDNPQWTFLLLTKFPVRMAEFEYPSNVWLGTSVDYQWAVERAEKAFTKIKASGFGGVCWLSCEPMMERLTFNKLAMFDWLVVGGSSKSTQTAEYRPPFDDIVHIYNQARNWNCKIYQKTNLIPGMSDEQRIREYPAR